MFTPLAPAEMVGAIGEAARRAARRTEPLDDFTQGQLKAAYSASRHLAVELETFDPALRDFRARMAAAAECAGAAATHDAAALDVVAARLARARNASSIGEAVCGLLDLCRANTEPAWSELRVEAQRALAALCDREVELLDAGLERAT